MFSCFVRDLFAMEALANVSRGFRGTALALILGLTAFALHLSQFPKWSATLSKPKLAPGITASSRAVGGAVDLTDLVIGPRGEDVRLSGEIVEGAADRLEALVDAHPGVKRIHLTSEGGLTDEAVRLGDVIAAHHLITYVPDYCLSACSLLFIRGVERYMLRAARIGFHAPYEVGSAGEDIAVDASDERDAYITAGVEAAFVDAALKVSPSNIWIPEAEALIRAHVATAAVGPDRFPDSNLDGRDDADGARETIVRNFPSLQVADGRGVELLDRAIAWYLAAYAAGQSEATVQRELQRYATLAQIQRTDATAGAARIEASSKRSTRIHGVAFTSAFFR